jgi:hypothetical protein
MNLDVSPFSPLTSNIDIVWSREKQESESFNSLENESASKLVEV